MGNRAVSHCRFPVLGNINGQFFRNHRWLVTLDSVSELPSDPRLISSATVSTPASRSSCRPKNVPLRETLEPGLPATHSELQIHRFLTWSLNLPVAAPSAGCSVSSSEAINFRVQRSGPIRENIGRDNLLNFMVFWEWNRLIEAVEKRWSKKIVNRSCFSKTDSVNRNNNHP